MFLGFFIFQYGDFYRVKLMQLKELRKQINCTIQEAKSLLEASNSDLEKAVELFYTQNIKKICQQTQCDEALAKKLYKEKQGHVARTIATIDNIMAEQKHRQRIITMREEKWRRNEIGFLIWGEEKNVDNYKIGEDYNFIPTDDFDVIIGAFRHVFPIHDYWTKETQQHFDATDNNTFDQQQMQIILKEIKSLKLTEEIQIKFQNEILCWLNQLTQKNELIIVEGNL